ncbi:hypothetical protein [Streptomyces sp. SID5789]|uniref:hypothetical protein n=1 Tax=Streptomyces sp. SID5789 TaxID=2690310 RepID=UPI00136F38D0|nr:hypothetical protein [Streptomyces sp. SID5789]MZE72974.1 hypothetical protein [Streptomyces sp. SID5789]
MDHVETVDENAVLRARALLLGSSTPGFGKQVEAYRILASVSPLAYLPKLTQALLSYGYAPEVRSRPEARLAHHEEAAAAARRIDAGEPRRTELLVRALSAYRAALYAVGRRAEVFGICEEMAAAGRWGFEHGQVLSPLYGHGPLAIALAESGRHQETAALYGDLMRATRPEGSEEVSFWTMLEWAAELNAAGQHDRALEAFADTVDTTRLEVDQDSSALAILAWQLVHQAGMLGAAGHHVEAHRIRREVLAVLYELDRTGERKTWSNILSWWTTLYALSGRSAEPVPRPSAPAPPFGFSLLDWSPDVKQAYFDGLPGLEAEVADLKGAATTDSREHLAALLFLHRRFTIRSALYCEQHNQDILKPLRPLFNEGVAFARRLADVAGGEESLAEVGRALTDRSMFLVAAKQYGEAYDDYCEVVDLLG